MKKRKALVLTAAVLPSPAAAHGFAPGANPWSQILAGASVPFAEPAILLALLPLGLALGIWRADGLPRLWTALAAGLAAGVVAAPLAGLSIAFAAILAGLATALMGAAALAWPTWLMGAATAGTGLVVAMTALEGHAPGSLPATVHIGMFMGAGVAVGLPFALVALSRGPGTAPWLLIGWRVLASWLAAIALMLAALRFA